MNNPVLPFEVNGSGKFYKNLFVDSTVNSWKIATQEIQTITAKISGNAQIDGTLLIGGAITIDGTNSRISSTSGTIDFDANNLTTTGNISASNVQVTGGIGTVGLTVTGSSLFGGNANFSGDLNALKISADSLFVSGTSVLNSLYLADGVVIQPFAGTATGGMVWYNSIGKLKHLDFPTDTNAVLTGGGAFKNLGSMVAPYTGWQWAGSDLVSTANDVYIPNSLHVGKAISIGPFKLKNGGAVDTIRTPVGLALVSDAQVIQLNADKVTASSLEIIKGTTTDTIRTMSAMELVSGNKDIRIRDTVTMTDAVGIGTRPAEGYSLDVAGNIRSSGMVNSNLVSANSISATNLTTNDLTTNNTISSPRIVTSRITSPDSLIYFGDSSLIYNDAGNQLGNSTNTSIKGLRLGNEGAYAGGENSVAIGHNVGTWYSAYKSITIGSGISNSAVLSNKIPNSLMVGFNSAQPTFFVGPSAGVGTTGKAAFGILNQSNLQSLTSKLTIQGEGNTNATSAFNVINGNPAPISLFFVRDDGHVGIGTTNPYYLSALDIRGSGKSILNIESPLSSDYAGIRFVRTDNGDFAHIYLENYGTTGIATNKNRLVFDIGDDGDDVGGADYIVFRNNHWSWGQKDVMEVRRNKIVIDANVGIGTTCPQYKLDVTGIIRSQEWIVENFTGCDYVFDKNYLRMHWKLKRDFYLKYCHLPNIDPASLSEKEGLRAAKNISGIILNLEEDRLDITELFERLEIVEQANKDKDKKIEKLQKEINELKNKK